VRFLICGTNYGATYFRALYANENGMIAGVLARSERSRALAAECGVPFYASVDDVPPDAIDAACVAIPGPDGHAVTSALLARGIHVLAEHPVYPAQVIEHRGTAREHGAVYHVNAHYSDLEAAATFVSAFQATRQRSKLLFVNVMTNTRALYSAIEIVGRAIGPLRPFTLEHVPLDAGSFFHLARAIVPGAPLTFQLQRISSAVDDGSANWVSHNITAGFDDGVLSLNEAFGPVAWMPSPPSLPRLQSPEAAELWARPLWRVLVTPPATFSDYAGWSRDRANRIAIARFVAEIKTGMTPPEQSDDHLLGVTEFWQAMIGTSSTTDHAPLHRREA